MPTTPALDVRRLRKSYGGRDVVAGLSLRAARGEIAAVLGPNGAGKTTTVECCEGLRRPDAGEITVLGLDRALPESAPALRERVGVMLQDGGLPLAPRAGSVLRHVARLHGRPGAAAGLLDRLGLAGVARTRVRRLSGGQRQRLALACAIVGDPELVFLDEPSAGLDPQSRLVVWRLLTELREQGTSIVLTTHLMAEAEELADHVVVIDAGRAVAAGSPRELRGPLLVRVAPGAAAAPAADELAAALAAPALDVTTGPDGHLEVSHRDGADLDSPAVAAVATALAERGAPDAEVSLRRASLEDVFLTLTGRELRTEAA